MTQQPSLSLERGTHRASHTWSKVGEGGRQRECQHLIINDFFYFYGCLWQWAEGTQRELRTLFVPTASLH